MIQDTVFVVTVLLMLVVAATFAFVAFNAGKEEAAYPSVQEKSYRIRTCPTPPRAATCRTTPR